MADFVAPYSAAEFTVVNSTFGNGSLQVQDAGRSLVLNGPNDGSGLAGRTDATVICRGSGVIAFQYSFASLDLAGFDTAGYLLNGQFYRLADADQSSGRATVSVSVGDVFGFRVESTDNTGERGILTVTEASFPPSLTATSVVSTPNPSAFGEPVTISATVTSGVGVPGGSVVFRDGTATLGTQALNGSGQATISVATLAVGSHSLTAAFVGSSIFAASTSAVRTQVVQPAATVTTLSSSVNPSTFGQSVTLTATVTAGIAGSGIPTGTVTFSDGDASLGTAALNAAGVASISISSLKVGAHTLIATYTPDGRYAGSFSGSRAQTVIPATTTVGLTATPEVVTKGQAVTLTATVSVTAPGAGTPTGTVVFKDGAATLGSASLNSSLRATLASSTLGVGTHVITATYSGDVNFSGATSPPVSATVNKAPTTTVLGPIGGPVSAGTCISLSATVSSAGGTPTGGITFRSGANVLATADLGATGVATATNVCLSIGDYLIVADYKGDANFSSSTSGSTPFSVNAIPTQITTPVLRSDAPIAGEVLRLEVRVTSEGPMTGSVTFYDSQTRLGSAPVDSGGVAFLMVRLGPGLHILTGYYEGDGKHAASRSEALVVAIKAVPAIKAASSPNPSKFGTETILTAVVSAPEGTKSEPTGNVVFLDGATSLGSATLSGGRSSIRTSALIPGEHTIVAAYSGDSNYTAVVSQAFLHRVTRDASATVLLAGVDSGGYYLVASVACASDSKAAATGSAQFEDVDRNAIFGSAALSNGSAMMRLADPLPVGHRLRATYAGDTGCEPSNSGVISFVAAANAFSFGPAPFALDAITSVFGDHLGETLESASSAALPRSMGGLRVDIVDSLGKSHPAGLYFVSPNQINFVVPADVPPGPAQLSVTTGGDVRLLSILVARASPALASLNGSGSGRAAAYLVRVHTDGSQDPPIVVSTNSELFGAATDRLYLILHGTGFRNGRGSATCIFNGEPMVAAYVGAHPIYPGLDQINVEIPDRLRGAGTIRVSCTIEERSTNEVTIDLH